MTEEDKDNPFVSRETCQARRETMVEKLRVLEEKIEGLKKTIAVGLTISSLIITAVQFFLTLR